MVGYRHNAIASAKVRQIDLVRHFLPVLMIIVDNKKLLTFAGSF